MDNQQPSSCLERVEKVQRLGHTTYSVSHGDEVRRAVDVLLEVPSPEQVKLRVKI